MSLLQPHLDGPSSWFHIASVERSLNITINLCSAQGRDNSLNFTGEEVWLTRVTWLAYGHLGVVRGLCPLIDLAREAVWLR